MINRPKGFTLIETLVYVAIFLTMIGALAAFAMMLQTSRLRAQVVLEVHDQGAAIMRTMTRVVRNGASIVSPTTGQTGTVLSLTTPDGATNPTTFSVTGEVLYVTEGASPAVALTNNKVKVTDLVFTNVSKPGTPGAIEIRFTLENTAAAVRSEQQYHLDFYGTAAIR